jgi:transcriptional regulator with XRE-family HTH domain
MPAERQVCERLSAARRFLNLSQDELAAAIGTTRDQLANIETGRTSLRFQIGWFACRHLNIDPWYLATGHSTGRGFRDINVASRQDISRDESFRSVCIGQLRDALDPQKIPAQKQLYLDWPDDLVARSYERAVVGVASAFLSETPPALRAEALEYLTRILREFVEKRRQNNLLTETSISGNLPAVKLQLEKLRERLNRITKESGKKTDLAEFLGAPAASVSRWLSGEREPGGETTLQMLKWVEQQESES